MASFELSADLADAVAKGLVEIPGLKRTAVDRVGGIYCHICHATYSTKKEYDSHYAVHGTGRAGADIIYTCPVCYREIPGYPSFRNHCYNKHVNKDKFKCNNCGKNYSKASQLQQHIDTIHTFKCITCKRQFPTKTELHLHKLIHKNENDKPPYECTSCGKHIDSVDMCELHIDEHTSITYPCPICDTELPSKADATSHLSIHFGEVLTEEEEIAEPTVKEDCSLNIVGGILCCYCGDLFKNRDEFDNHFPYDHPGKEFVYSCNICGKQYDKDKYPAFSNHCYLHIARDRFECEECGKTFPRLSLLVVHTEAFHCATNADAKPFVCACGHAFGSEKRLREHSFLAHKEVSMRCLHPGCDMSFPSVAMLARHRRARAHGAAAAAARCRRCGLALRSRPAAAAHLAQHRRAAYRCPVCRKPYREKFTLLRHLPCHFENVLHVCKVCGRAFAQRSRLAQHSKTHSALRAHACGVCGKGFVTRSNLQQHLDVHAGRQRACPACPKAFTSYPNWLKHLKRMHDLDGKLIKKGLNAAKNTETVVNKIDEMKTNIENELDKMEQMEQLEQLEQLEPGSALESSDSSLDGIDPAALDREWRMLGHTALELAMPSLLSDALAEARPPEPEWRPREFGPEVAADDGELPHIDPRLTIKPRHHYPPPCPAHYPAHYPPQPAWEPPVITKYFSNSFEDMTNANRISILNTDIF